MRMNPPRSRWKGFFTPTERVARILAKGYNYRLNSYP